MKVGYLRISSEDQAKGLSPEIQRQVLINAGAQHVFEDLGLSGYFGKRRPGFEALMEAVAAGQVGQVVWNTYSRLSRNAKDSARLDDALLAAGATVLDLGTGQTYEPQELTPELLARQESRQKSKRIRQTYQSFKDAGLSHSAKAPGELASKPGHLSTGGMIHRRLKKRSQYVTRRRTRWPVSWWTTTCRPVQCV